MDASTLGERIRSVRRRRGLTQRELATAAGASESLIKKLEQGTITDLRLETLHKFAVVLKVPTSHLAAGPDARAAEVADVSAWEPVRQALSGEYAEDAPDEEPNVASVRDALDTAVADVLDNRYADLRIMLPALLRDADDVVAVSASGETADARRVRSQSRQLAAYMLGQTGQFSSAEQAIGLASDDADDALTAMAAADWKSWILIRQGRLGDALSLAVQWADEAEPRVSRASAEEFAAWGRFQLRVTSAAIRDNRPDDARESMRLARIAAAGMGRDFIPSFNRWQVFGPTTVAMFQAQNALIDEHPEVALRIGQRLEGERFPLPETWNRHRLDVAQAHVLIREYPEAVAVLADIRRTAPEWFAQQQYAHDIVAGIVRRRRTLTPEMRELADAVRLPL
jgi:transcriptional regulator with XRE-family HTH domain